MARAPIMILFVFTIIFVLVNVRYVYAQSITVTPDLVGPASSFQVSGTGFSPNNLFGAVVVFADTSGSCSGLSPLGEFVSSDGSGNVAAVTFSSSSLGLGKHCVEMSFTSPSQVADSYVTVQAPSTTSTSVLCSPATIDVGSTSFCTVTVSGATGTISGETISWSSSGNLYFSSTVCTLSGVSCAVQVTGTPPGAGSVTAFYSGDSNNNPSQGSSPLTINPTGVVTVTVTVCGPPVGGIISAPDKVAILGGRVDFLGLIVAIVVVIAVITAPVTFGKHDS